MAKTKCPISEAARLIREGGLVAFPTETVYGLGANALDADAVRKIYAAKGRPSTSPLIVHVNSVKMARDLASRWPEQADMLARVWWPGPLTIVVPKRPEVPDVVTAGLDTVGLRMPRHPIALELIRTAGLPIAAPSANRFTEVSPTTAEHVIASLGNAVDCVIDGGPTDVGIESTVLSLVDVPVLLRPGMISREEIQALIGPVHALGSVDEAHPSPGMHPRHYSPRTRVILGPPPKVGAGAHVYLTEPGIAARVIGMPRDARRYAATLYATLRELDQAGLDWIAIEMPPDAPEWTGIRDRLTRAGAR